MSERSPSFLTVVGLGAGGFTMLVATSVEGFLVGAGIAGGTAGLSETVRWIRTRRMRSQAVAECEQMTREGPQLNGKTGTV